MSKRHVNIPIFIPHEGCPNNCVFCNQHTITSAKNAGSSRDIRPEIEECLGTVDTTECECEIAFFGGSFTGIPRNDMIRLLEVGYEYVTSGKVSSIRLSTRPDFIDEEILDILAKYGVRHIELGIQSLDDTVLEKSKRGHTAEQTKVSCTLIKQYGFSLTGQMMIGLPGATPESEIMTAKGICELGADSARVYPTVVFYGTELCEMSREGIYKPLENQEAALRSAAVCEVFIQNNVTLLRVGLQANEGLSEGKIYGGASHSAIGEMAFSVIYRNRMCEICEKMTSNGELVEGDKAVLTVFCAEGETSKVSGQKRVNKEYIKQMLFKKGIKVLDVKISETKEMEKYRVKITVEKK